MIINIEMLENALKNIENVVGTEWLEKWVHEIKELEFYAAPTKNYQDLLEKIPPMAVIWCKAQDEFTMMSLTGGFKLNKLLLKAYEIGRNFSMCEKLPGFEKQIEILKSNDRCSFEEVRYRLSVAAGYTGLGYRPLLGSPLKMDYKGTPIQLFCHVSENFTQKDLDLHKFWYVLSTELVRRLTFYKNNRAVLITAREFPKLEDVMGIMKKVSPKIEEGENQADIELDIDSKYIVHLKTMEDLDNPGDELRVPCNYEFGTVIGPSVIAFNLVGGSDRERAIINICNGVNDLSDKKISTILYVDIPADQAEQPYVPIQYYSEQIKIKYISNLKNLSKIIISTNLSETNRMDLNRWYIGNSIKNNYASEQLPLEFVPYIPG